MALFYTGKHRSRRAKPPLLTVLTALCLVSFAVFSCMFLRENLQSKKEQAAFDGLSALVAQAETTGEEHAAATAAPAPDTTGSITPAAAPVLSQYAALYEQNRDFAGWLLLGGEISLPVMYTPYEPEYYLRRAFDKTDSQSGTPFIGKDGSTEADCFIIYGHNMKNNTMFGPLDDYRDSDFWTENKTFSFDTLYETREYEVFAAAETRILNTDDAGFRYYNSSGDLTEAQYRELTDWLSSQSLYDTGIVPDCGEQILILSTCSYHTGNGRFIVAARRIS